MGKVLIVRLSTLLAGVWAFCTFARTRDDLSVFVYKHAKEEDLQVFALNKASSGFVTRKNT